MKRRFIWNTALAAAMMILFVPWSPQALADDKAEKNIGTIAGPYQAADGLEKYKEDTGQTKIQTPTGTAVGQCVWFMKSVRTDLPPGPIFGGNARDMWPHFTKIPKPPGSPWHGSTTVPKPGAIACFNKTCAEGHVAIVTKVYTDGSVDVWDSNARNDLQVRNRHLTPSMMTSYGLQGYLYAADSETPPILQLAGMVEDARDGDTIRLAAGEYVLDKKLLVTKSLTIIGESVDKVIVSGNGIDSIVRFQGDCTWTIRNITFRRAGGIGDVCSVAGGKVDIERCVFSGGVRKYEESAEGGYPGSGLVISGSARGSIRDCTFKDNGLHGIGARDTAVVTIVGSRCQNNSACGIYYGYQAAGKAEGNECGANGMHGIAVVKTAKPEIVANRCNHNKETGICYQDSASGLCKGNVCTSNGSDGIIVTDSTQPTLDDNRCAGNGCGGISFLGKASGSAKGNTCSTNTLSGILIQGSAHPTITDNACTMNKENGIAYFGQASGTAKNNACTSNGLNGIAVNDSSSPTLIGNQYSANGGKNLLIGPDAKPR